MSRSFKSHIKLEVSIRCPSGESRRWIHVHVGLRVGVGGGSPECRDTQTGVVSKEMIPSEISLCKYSLRTEPWGLVNFRVGVDEEEPASDGEGATISIGKLVLSPTY